MLGDAMEQHRHFVDLKPVIKAKPFHARGATISRMSEQCTCAHRQAARTPQGCQRIWAGALQPDHKVGRCKVEPTDRR